MELKLTVCIVASFAYEALYIPVIEGTESQAKASFAGLLCILDTRLVLSIYPDISSKLQWKKVCGHHSTHVETYITHSF